MKNKLDRTSVILGAALGGGAVYLLGRTKSASAPAAPGLIAGYIPPAPVGDQAEVGDLIVLANFTDGGQTWGYVSDRLGLTNVPADAFFVVARVDQKRDPFLVGQVVEYNMRSDGILRDASTSPDASGRTGVTAYPSEVQAVVRNGRLIAEKGTLPAPWAGQPYSFAGAFPPLKLMTPKHAPAGTPSGLPGAPGSVEYLRAALGYATSLNQAPAIINSLRKQLDDAMAAAARNQPRT